MSDASKEKERHLKRYFTWNPNADRVQDELFQQSEFFDPCDLMAKPKNQNPKNFHRSANDLLRPLRLIREGSALYEDVPEIRDDGPTCFSRAALAAAAPVLSS